MATPDMAYAVEDRIARRVESVGNLAMLSLLFGCFVAPFAIQQANWLLQEFDRSGIGQQYLQRVKQGRSLAWIAATLNVILSSLSYLILVIGTFEIYSSGYSTAPFAAMLAFLLIPPLLVVVAACVIVLLMKKQYEEMESERS